MKARILKTVAAARLLKAASVADDVIDHIAGQRVDLSDTGELTFTLPDGTQTTWALPSGSYVLELLSK